MEASYKYRASLLLDNLLSMEMLCVIAKWKYEMSNQYIGNKKRAIPKSFMTHRHLDGYGKTRGQQYKKS